MIFITGDCHGDWTKFSMSNFPLQKELTHEDFVIVCGDFGLWQDTESERWWLDWFNRKNFTTLFVDGNHENFDRLRNEFKTVSFHGGKAHQIRENVYHLMRGYVFNLCGKKFFCFGGASSHDIQDGILNLEDYPTIKALIKDYNRRTKQGQMLRINHLSWWENELPTKYERQRGRDILKKNNYEVDYIISHCLPQSVAAMAGYYGGDVLVRYFDSLLRDGLKFTRWFSGHYHREEAIAEKFIIKYHNIERIV